MKILYINHYDRSYDAASLSSYEVIDSLTSLGHDVVVLTNDPCEKDQTKVKRIVISVPAILEKNDFLRLLRCTIFYLPVFLAGLKIGKKENIDCIFSQHHNFHLATFTASILASFLGVPHLVKIQDGIPWAVPSFEPRRLEKIYNNYFMKALSGYALRRASSVLALSEETEKMLVEIFGIQNDRVIILPNTLKPTLIKPLATKEMKRKLELEGWKILIFVGGTTGRGIELLVMALPQVISAVPNVKLLLVGQNPSHDALKKLATSLGVEKHVQSIGPVDHSAVAALISMSDVAIGPLLSFISTVGAVPRKVLEYMACGKPVVASYGSLSQDLLIEGYNGLLVKSGDVDDMASAIIKLLKNEKLARKLGNNAKKHVSEFYSEEVATKRLTMLINNMFATK